MVYSADDCGTVVAHCIAVIDAPIIMSNNLANHWIYNAEFILPTRQNSISSLRRHRCEIGVR